MSDDLELDSHDEAYRPLSPWAVGSLVFGAMSALGVLNPMLTGMALLGAACALMAFWAIRKYEVRGRGVARLGFGLSVMYAVVIPWWHLEQFRSEAPAGVIRLDFEKVVSSSPGKADLEAYFGQRVCLKGYVYPTDQYKGITSFYLTRNGTSQRDGDFIGVILASPQTWNWSSQGQSVTGTLIPNPNFKGEETPRWILKECEVRPSRCPIQIASRARGTGC